MANSNVAGYLGSGIGSENSVDKFAFISDTRSTLGTGIEFGRYDYAGHANSGVAGYFLCGRRPDTGQYTNRATKFSFPTDSATNLADATNNGIDRLAGMANSGVAGYLGGGFDAGEGSRVNVIRKMVYSSDSSSNLGATLSGIRNYLAANANSGTAGYFAGGIGASNVRASTVDKLTFSSDTRSTLGTGLSGARYYFSGMAHSGTAGYFGGGTSDSIVTISTVDKFSFPDDTRSTLGTGLSSSREGLGAMASSGTL
jgi:hypothetical protein